MVIACSLLPTCTRPILLARHCSSSRPCDLSCFHLPIHRTVPQPSHSKHCFSKAQVIDLPCSQTYDCPRLSEDARASQSPIFPGRTPPLQPHPQGLGDWTVMSEGFQAGATRNLSVNSHRTLSVSQLLTQHLAYTVSAIRTCRTNDQRTGHKIK